MSPPTSIAPTSEFIKTEPNPRPHLPEDHRRMSNTVSHSAEASVTLTIYIVFFKNVHS